MCVSGYMICDQELAINKNFESLHVNQNKHVNWGKHTSSSSSSDQEQQHGQQEEEEEEEDMLNNSNSLRRRRKRRRHTTNSDQDQSQKLSYKFLKLRPILESNDP